MRNVKNAYERAWKLKLVIKERNPEVNPLAVKKIKYIHTVTGIK